jgi:hypothetical protein
MRARNLKPGFFKNEELAELPFECRILFEGLWCIADRIGRLEDRPKKIKGEVFPYDNCDVDQMLNLLANSPEKFITRYEVEDKRYIQVNNFLAHNKPHPREIASVIPPYQNTAKQNLDMDEAQPRHDPGNNQALSSPAGSSESPIQDLLNPGSSECGILNPEAPASILSILAELKKVKDYPFDAAKDIEYLATLAGDFPTLDMLQEIKSWSAYKLDHPLLKDSAPHSQLRNWCKKAVEIQSGKGGVKNGIHLTVGAGSAGSTKEPKYPMRNAFTG